MHLPEPNMFIATRFDVKKTADSHHRPELIVNQSMLKVQLMSISVTVVDHCIFSGLA